MEYFNCNYILLECINNECVIVLIVGNYILFECFLLWRKFKLFYKCLIFFYNQHVNQNYICTPMTARHSVH